MAQCPEAAYLPAEGPTEGVWTPSCPLHCALLATWGCWATLYQGGQGAGCCYPRHWYHGGIQASLFAPPPCLSHLVLAQGTPHHYAFLVSSPSDTKLPLRHPHQSKVPVHTWLAPLGEGRFDFLLKIRNPGPEESCHSQMMCRPCHCPSIISASTYPLHCWLFTGTVGTARMPACVRVEQLPAGMW